MSEPKKIEVEESVLKDMMTEMKGMRESISSIQDDNKILKEENASLKKSVKPEASEEVMEKKDFTPTHLQIRTYKEFPIVKISSYSIDDPKKQGETITMCDIENSKGEKAKMRLEGGYSGGEDNFFKLPLVEYQLCNVDTRDKTGASRVEMDKVITNLGKVEYVSRGDEGANRTGKMIDQVVTRDIRYYTILVDGKEIELHQDNIIK